MSIRGALTLTPWAFPTVLSPLADSEMQCVQYGFPFLLEDPEWSQGEQLKNGKLTMMEHSLVIHLIWLTIYFGNTQDGFHMVFLTSRGLLPVESGRLRSNPGWGRGKKYMPSCKVFHSVDSVIWKPPMAQSLYFQLLFSYCLTTLGLMDDFIISRVDSLEEKAL